MDWRDQYTGAQPVELYKTYTSIHIKTNKNGSTSVVTSNQSVKCGERKRQFYSINRFQTVKGLRYRPCSTYRREWTHLLSNSPASLERYNPTSSVSYESATSYASSGYPRMTLGANAGEQHPTLGDQAVTELLSDMAQVKAQYLTTLAESVKTVNHLADRVEHFALFLIKLRRGHWRDAFRHLLGHNPKWDSPAKLWLEYQYAWKPLMFDIFDHMEAAKASFVEGMAIKGKRSVTEHFEASNPSFWSPDGRWSHDVVYRYRETWTAVILALIDDANLKKAQGYGLTNPALTGWEVLPYTFVIDWFIPIGTFLEAITAPQGLTFVTGSLSTNVDGEFKSSYRRAQTDGWKTVGRGSAEAEYRLARRQTIQSWPKPVPYGKSPFSTTKVTSALALVTQLRR